MQLGMIGAGRMGANMSRRITTAGHEVHVMDVDAARVQPLGAEGLATHTELSELVQALEPPRAIWMMIPAGFVGATIDEIRPLLDDGDILVDGGNSWYRDAINRANDLNGVGVSFVDCGTSGGVFGLERGYCLMIGGDAAAVGRLEPIFESLAPGVEAEPRTGGRSGSASAAEQGYLHCGPPGAGHFVKMVHNGIEYGMMAAYAEGLNLLHHAGVGRTDEIADAETTPLRDPSAYQFDFQLDDIAELWRRGSVIGSWLLDLTAHALSQDPGLESYAGSVSDSGEGRWTVQAAIDVAAPVPVLSAALFSRFDSRDEGRFGAQVLSAMRAEFGGHVERSSSPRSDS